MAKFVRPLVKTIEQYAQEIYNEPVEKLKETQKIEIAGRTCYNSISSINVNKNTDINFSVNLIKRRHFPVLEFGNVCLKINNVMSDLIYLSGYKFLNQTYSKENGHLISGSIRAWRDLIKSDKLTASLSEFLLYYLKNCSDIGVLFEDIEENNKSFIKCAYELSRISDFSNFNEEEKKKHIYKHFVIITDRAVLAELTRHRICAFAVQSQRYVNYKDGVEFVYPHWISKKQDQLWISACEFSEEYYKLLIYNGKKPQDARTVLNNSVKTIINICCNGEELEHIFNMRCDKSAHPDIQIIANKMKELI